MMAVIRTRDGELRNLYDVRPNAYNWGEQLELVYSLLDEALAGASVGGIWRNKNPTPIVSLKYPYTTFEVESSKEDNEHGLMVYVDIEFFDRGLTSGGIDKLADLVNNELDHKRHLYDKYYVRTELEHDRDIPDETDRELLRRSVAMTFYIERRES
ncbi:gp10 [Listeria phage P40]|uniref:head protein n=1 Tax=Listeria phage P40 TaxID=560178 RepID=UPI00018198C1|nr:head protein [Listeria phage P40]ACI00370.1 gp10 [Listeria phage P40]